MSARRHQETIKGLSQGIREQAGRFRHAESGLKYILLCIFITFAFIILPFLGLDFPVLIVMYLIAAGGIIGLTFWVNDAGDVRLLILLLAAASIFERFTLISGKTELRLAGLAVTLAFVGILTLFCLFAVILARHPIHAHIIWAAISVYLLFGVLFAIAFEMMGILVPGSVVFTTRPSDILTTADYIYYSYSTLFTLSYGDYIPVGYLVRSMALLEVLLGIFFTAIIISKLVGFTVLPGFDDNPAEETRTPPGTRREQGAMNERLTRIEEVLRSIESENRKKK